MSIPKPPGYWTAERIKAKVKKHKSLKDFFTKDFDAYSAASRLKILDPYPDPLSFNRTSVIGPLTTRCYYRNSSC